MVGAISRYVHLFVSNWPFNCYKRHAIHVDRCKMHFCVETNGTVQVSNLGLKNIEFDCAKRHSKMSCKYGFRNHIPCQEAYKIKGIQSVITGYQDVFRVKLPQCVPPQHISDSALENYPKYKLASQGPYLHTPAVLLAIRNLVLPFQKEMRPSKYLFGAFLFLATGMFNLRAAAKYKAMKHTW